MDASVLVALFGLGAVIAFGIWMLLNRRHPENYDDHMDRSPTTASDEFYGGVDRPAGPDAEPMHPDLLGGDQRPPNAPPR